MRRWCCWTSCCGVPNKAEVPPESGLANLLEPPALLRHFREHLPLGFRLLPGEATAFAAPLDLLTTTDAALRRRVRGWPGFRWWGRWLRWPAAFVGSTVTEYAVLPWPRDDAELEAWPRCWRDGLGAGQRLLVVKDLPQESPLLPADANRHAERLAEACRRAGYLLLQGQALAYVPIDFTDTSTYLERLSPGRRKNLKRKLRSRALLDVTLRPCGDAAFADEGVVDAYHGLYRQVYAQSELHFDELPRSFLAAVLRDAQARGVVFEYRRRSDGAFVGWNLCFESRGLLIDKYIGLAYPAARELDLYFVSWFANLEHALARGCTHYVAGWTDPEVKARLGARFTFTRHAVYLRQPLLRWLMKPLAPWFEGDRRALGAAPD